MSRFHISKDGQLRKCSAKPESCPLKTEHFENLNDATNFVESENKKKHSTFKKLSKVSTPGNLQVEPLTKEKVEDMLKSSKKPTEVLGYCYAGSIMYNLDSPESDRDIFVLNGENYSFNTYSNEMDLAVVELDAFIGALDKSGSHVDLLLTKQLNMDESPYKQFVYSRKFNPYRYAGKTFGEINRIEKLAQNETKNIDRKFKNVIKCIKTSLKLEKLLEHGWDGFNPRSTDDERDQFFKIKRNVKNELTLNNADEILKHFFKNTALETQNIRR